MAIDKVRYAEPGMEVKTIFVNTCTRNDEAQGFENDDSIGNMPDYLIETSEGVWEEGYLDDDNRLCIGKYPED